MGYADIKKRRNGQGDNGKSNTTPMFAWNDSARKALLDVIGVFVIIAGTAAIPYFILCDSSSWTGYSLYILLPVFVLSAVVGICSYRKYNRASKECVASNENKRNILQEELEAWKNQLIRKGCFSVVSVDIALQRDEAAFYVSSSHLFEVRSVRVTNHAGAGMRVSRRVSVGGGRSVSESHDEWRPVAHGKLYLTNKRVVFVGDTRSRTIDLKNIVSIRGGYDMLEIVSDAREKSMRFTVANWAIAKVTLDYLVTKRGTPLSSITTASSGGDVIVLEGGVKAEMENPYANGIDISTVRLAKSLSGMVAQSPVLRNMDNVVTVPQQVRKLFGNGSFPIALSFVVAMDALKCHLRLGHTIDDLKTEDGFGLLSIMWVVLMPGAGDNIRALTSSQDVFAKTSNVAIELCHLLTVSEDDKLLSVDILKNCVASDVHKEYLHALYEWALAIASVDGVITPVEQRWLNHLRSVAEQ